MGQACVHQKQVSEVNISVEEQFVSQAKRPNAMRGSDERTTEKKTETLFVSEGCEFDHGHHRRHEKHQVLGRNTLPKEEHDSDGNLSF